jgi:RimK family alpha-L-glutamate ligase
MPGFVDRLPDSVFVRGVPGGTLEQVIARLDVLHALKLLGVPVYNDARAIERTVDKAMTSFLLAHAGVATPPTWTLEPEEQARELVRREIAAGHDVVIKPLFGSQGTGLKRIAGIADLPPPEEYNGVYYLQRFVKPDGQGWRDWRVFVINGRAEAAMFRRGTSWISNVAQGARCSPALVDDELRGSAEAASRALQVDYAGVDLMRDADGRLLVIEVNGIPAWRGLQSVSAIDIAQRLVDDLLERHLPAPALQSVA